MKDEPNQAVRGVRLRHINYLIVALVTAFAVMLLYNLFLTIHSYQTLQEDISGLLAGQQAAREVQDASDYLTDQVRLYTATGDWTHAENYFREAEVTRRRERALETLESLSRDEESMRHLSQAIQRSSTLMTQEYHAMLLVMAAGGGAPETLPQALADMKLPPEEAALTAAKQMELARELVFGQAYQEAKGEISSEVQQCTGKLTEALNTLQQDSAARLLVLLRRQRILIVLLLLAILVMVFLAGWLIFLPLQKNIGCIQAKQPMSVTGAREVRFLASAYNEMYQSTKVDQEQLSYEATHDPLTGALNRKGYENALAGCDLTQTALILVDVDYFKSYNDTYGHEMGDRVLKRVAGTLREFFRSEDCVCRVGGDEFVVLMVHAGSRLEQLVTGKMAAVADRLRTEEDGVPALTLSVGIAFGDLAEPGISLFEQADKALYRVKELGRNGRLVWHPQA